MSSGTHQFHSHPTQLSANVMLAAMHQYITQRSVSGSCAADGGLRNMSDGCRWPRRPMPGFCVVL